MEKNPLVGKGEQETIPGERRNQQSNNGGSGVRDVGADGVGYLVSAAVGEAPVGSALWRRGGRDAKEVHN